MKGILTPILISVAILLAISSCTMVGKGELKLLSMEVPKSERLRTNVQFWVRVNFEADGNPEIRRACFFWSGDGPYCVNVKDVEYGCLHTSTYRFTLVMVHLSCNVMVNIFETKR